MATCDIGIDLGTSSVVIYVDGKGVVLDEPSVVAYNIKTKQLIAVGSEAYKMVGRTPDYIEAKMPIQDGVISDYYLNEMMINEYLKRVSNAMLMKPRVAICIHSLITDVERRAVIDAAVAAGARKVYLIDEPIAAAVGAGVDISQPNGVMVVDIGGGTTDAAVISLNGVVKNKSVKIGGRKFDAAIVKYILGKYKLLIGEKMAEKLKMESGTACDPDPTVSYKVKGRNLLNGLPAMVEINQLEVFEAVSDLLDGIVQTIKDVLEKTPPELCDDVHTNGIVVAGGGALFGNMAELIRRSTHIETRIADEPLHCVAYGTGKSFAHISEFNDGFSSVSTHKH